MLLDVNCAIAPTKTRLQVSNDCVQPLKYRHHLWLPAPDRYRDVVAPSGSYSPGIGQAGLRASRPPS